MNDTNERDVFFLVGDANRARVVRPGAGDSLEVLWEAFSATPDVRSLGQAPDIDRKSNDATPPARPETSAQFAHEVSDRVRLLAGQRPGLRLVVVAPPTFARELEADLGSAWPTRAGDVIARDETRLDDTALRTLIQVRLHAAS
jgi:hypothetical protein